MKARPIIFQDAMVRALLEGRKTQTRRVVKGVERDNSMKRKGSLRTHVLDAPERGLCPYGQPGDLLWVREAWGLMYERSDGTIKSIQGPGSVIPAGTSYEVWYRADAKGPRQGPWRPSIHMPKEYSRLTLRLTDVRVERVQEISEEDAEAEGVPFDPGGNEELGVGYGLGFARLWDSINAAKGYGWDANPWVWVLEFEVIHANVDAVLADPERYMYSST